jgi:hypothetical protein
VSFCTEARHNDVRHGFATLEMCEVATKHCVVLQHASSSAVSCFEQLGSKEAQRV